MAEKHPARLKADASHIAATVRAKARETATKQLLKTRAVEDAAREIVGQLGGDSQCPGKCTIRICPHCVVKDRPGSVCKHLGIPEGYTHREWRVLPGHKRLERMDLWVEF